MQLRNLILMILFGAGSGVWAEIFSEGAHCVAYKVQKTVFFLSDRIVIGKNCDISAQVLPEVGGLYHIEVNVPVRSFRSGEAERDKDVMVILKSDERPELTFRSKALTAEEWRRLFAKDQFDLEGELIIGKNSFPLKMVTRYSEKSENAEVNGMVQVRFADFGIKPPKVAGGFIAKSKPDLELHFRLQSQRVLGADSIRPIVIQK